MDNPRSKASVRSESVGDGLAVYDAEQKQPYVLNATSALVFQRCDGQTTPEKLTELLCRKFNIPRGRGEELLWLSLAELDKANLLETKLAPTEAPQRMHTRRQALAAFAAGGLSMALLPIVAPGVVHAAAARVFPTVQCVVDNGDGTYTAWFGYVNTSSSTIIIPYDPNIAKNQFTATPKYRGQPGSFVPGVHENVFSVTWDGSPLTWLVKEDNAPRQHATASANSPRCPEPTTTTTEPTTTTTEPTTTTT